MDCKGQSEAIVSEGEGARCMVRRRRMNIVVVGMLSMLVAPGHALAWGYEGHRIAVEIASTLSRRRLARERERARRKAERESASEGGAA